MYVVLANEETDGKISQIFAYEKSHDRNKTKSCVSKRNRVAKLYNFYSFDLKSVINSPSSISSIKNVHL